MDINTCFATTEAYRNLALYSHLIPALAVLVLGIFAYLRAPNRLKAATFFAFSLAFAAWLVGDLIVWTSDSYNIVAAFWAPLDLIEIIFFLLIFVFALSDFSGNALGRGASWLLIAAAGVPFYLTVTGQSVYELYHPVCEMLNNRFLEEYKVTLEAALFLATCVFGIRSFLKSRGADDRIRIAIIAFSVAAFMAIFGGTEYIANTTYVYETHLYALFTLPVFVLLLTIAITNYGTFRLGDTAVKTLFYIFLILAGTQFFFVEDLFHFLLAAMSFGVVLTLGIMLFRSTERELRAKHELEIANKQQENLLHFISHEVKGYLTESQAGFAAIVEGDMGAVSDKVKEMSTSALANVRKGVRTVMEILDASNFRKGTVGYKKDRFDLKDTIQSVIDHQQK